MNNEQVQEAPEFSNGEWYLALKKDAPDESLPNWEVVQYIDKNGKTGFGKSRNLLNYTLESFRRVLPNSLLNMLGAYKSKNIALHKENEALKTICQREVERKKLKTDNCALIDELLKVTYAAVDNINGDMGMSCGDLESNNNRLVKIVTQLRDRGVEP